MDTSANARSATKAFTLVEMLVVITIIGMLMALLSAAVIGVRKRVRNGVIQAEISQFDMSLENYKTEFTEFPPDFANINHSDPNVQAAARAEVARHIRKAFPRYDFSATGDPFLQFLYDLANYQQDSSGGWWPAVPNPDRLDPASALVLFLGGLPESVLNSDGTWNAEWIPAGFHADPEHPFKAGLPRTKPLYDFDPERLHIVEPHPNGSTFPERYLRYYPSTVECPYVYFKARRIGGVWRFATPNPVPPPVAVSVAYQHASAGPGLLASICVPYADEYDPSKLSWRNYDTYQVISAGLDAQFGQSGIGTVRYSKDGTNFTEGDFDNIPNFGKGRLQDEM